MKTYIFNTLYQLFLKRKHKVNFGNHCRLSRDSTFEGFNYIGNRSEFYNSSIGKASYIGHYSCIKKTKIGRFCSVGDYVRTGLGAHPTKDFVSTHPAFFSKSPPVGVRYTKEQRFEEHKFVNREKKFYVIIQNDVWIGNNVLIMDGITIGTGAVIGAGSIVTKDIPPYSIAIGTPARITKKRFDDDTVSKLLSSEWWNYPDDKLKQVAPYFDNAEEFLKYLTTSDKSESNEL